MTENKIDKLVELKSFFFLLSLHPHLILEAFTQRALEDLTTLDMIR